MPGVGLSLMLRSGRVGLMLTPELHGDDGSGVSATDVLSLALSPELFGVLAVWVVGMGTTKSGCGSQKRSKLLLT